MKNSPAIFSSAYFPPIDYFSALLSGKIVFLEGMESYQKQSYRNRCRIFSADGVMELSVPIIKGNLHPNIRDVKIDYSKPWLQQHKRALISSYNSSPFFEYYKDELFEILDSKIEFLFDLNTELIVRILDDMQIGKEIVITSDYINQYGETMDYRATIHPKRDSPIFTDNKKLKPYYQIFSDKYGFKPNLSILDLLFCEGPNALTFLIDKDDLLELKS